MEQLSGKVAVVTGGASGIGLALGHAFAAEGMNVMLADIEVPALEEAAKAVGTHGTEVRTFVCDVSDALAVDALREETVAAFGTAHVVCNNAGVGGGGSTWDSPLESWEWVIGVNLWGVIHGIRSFVPLLVEQGEGHVVNTASAAGLLTMPYMAAYAATKHAVVAITESLSMELQINASAVGASVLCPMWVKTRIHESRRNAPDSVVKLEDEMLERQAVAGGMRDLISGLVESGLDPAVVAGMVVDAVKGNRFYVLPHEDVKAGVLARANRIVNGETPVLHLPAN